MLVGDDNLGDYVCQANDCVCIKLVKELSDIDNDNALFHPTFTHQLYGEQESIFGYRNLEVQLYYTSGHLTTYLNKTFTDKIDPHEIEGIQADDVLKPIVENIPPGYHDNIDNFSIAVEKDGDFKPFGIKIHSYQSNKEDSDSSIMEIYKCDMTNSGFRQYHERLQTFVLWFIDGASYIDIDDDRWNYYVMYEKMTTSTGRDRYCTVGYLTVYDYYAYPDKIRPRISQMLVLPPYQRCGHGVELLETVYNNYINQFNVLDITVEDPSEDFQALRSYVDSKRCLKLDMFSTVYLMGPFTKQMITQAQDRLKINKKQTREVYEILKMYVINMNDTIASNKYKYDIKKRLSAPFQKRARELEKMKRYLSDEEYTTTLVNNDPTLVNQRMEEQYQLLIPRYTRTVNRLSLNHC